MRKVYIQQGMLPWVCNRCTYSRVCLPVCVEGTYRRICLPVCVVRVNVSYAPPTPGWLFPFHCWLRFALPCASVLSVAGLGAFLPVSLLVDNSSLFSHHPFHCWSMPATCTTRFTVGDTHRPGPRILYSLTFLIFRHV